MGLGQELLDEYAYEMTDWNCEEEERADHYARVHSARKTAAWRLVHEYVWTDIKGRKVNVLDVEPRYLNNIIKFMDGYLTEKDETIIREAYAKHNFGGYYGI